MENFEMSTNITASGSFHCIDVPRKSILADHSDVDSGFVENWSISHSNAIASTSGISSSTKHSSLSFKKSIDLETISENVEIKDNLHETPTTRSIRYINDFHINTPQNKSCQMETTPTKINYFSNIHCSDLKKNARNVSQNMIRWSLNKSSPRQKAQAKQKPFKTPTKSFKSIDEEYENIYNDEEGNPCDQSIGVSPIKPYNCSNMTEKQFEKIQELQRHPSGIESSTPKNRFKRTRTQSIVKTKTSYCDEMFRKLTRKTQSFSPSKRSALREANYQHLLEAKSDSIDIDEHQDNPARKVLAFNQQNFDKLVALHFNPFMTSPSTTSLNVDSDRDTKNGCNKVLSILNGGQLKHVDAHKSSRLVREFTGKRLTKNSKSSKQIKSSYEHDISMLSVTENNTDFQIYEDNSMNISNSIMISNNAPSKNGILPENLNNTPTQNNLCKLNIRDNVKRTPIKRFEKSTSYHFIQTKSSPEKEKFDIVYGHLPCTPPKKYRQLKRTANTRSDSTLLSAPSAKRKLYQLCERPSFYNGFEKLDILTHLKKFDHFDHIIEKILECLPDESLQAAYSVCKSWRNVVDGNQKFRTRRRNFVKKIIAIKENVHQNETKTNISRNISTNNYVKPLHKHNLNCESEEKPTAVSPSTQRFNEHQKIIKTLKPEQRVLHCPRCNGTSIVHPVTTSDFKPQRRSPRWQNNTLPMLLERPLRAVTKNRTNFGFTKIVVSEYAVCSQKRCGFEFCTNCNFNRHINDKCTKRPLGSSPKSDDDSPYKHEHQSTKRQLRRLRRLVF